MYFKIENRDNLRYGKMKINYKRIIGMIVKKFGKQRYKLF